MLSMAGLPGHLRVLATSLYKISTDLRWMNSGPLSGLAPTIGCEAAAKIVKKAYQTGKSIFEIAKQETDVSEQRLPKLLDPLKLTKQF